ncbi:LysM peptidoglycan-binding domain-containing protein [Actinotalea solisilvae]|uniref:LysM peptidoglycan-binding domain-containing protein n=1 Tax=Actinotalea solisilvae TaxID=2072922 RepID=UPI0018F13E30|nr:LysM peptidoglycan-binding domain-containing protein [Actinotalea solisilvae]
MMERTETQVRRPEPRKGGDLLRGLLAAAAIVAFVIGVPAALLVVAPVRVPTSLPTWRGVIDAASRPDDGSLLLGVVTVIAWLAWLAFALPLVIEIASSVRAVRTPHLPLLAPAQRLAAGLVATAGLLLTPPAPTASAWGLGQQTAAAVAAHVLPTVAAGPSMGPSGMPASRMESPAAPSVEDGHASLPSVTVLRGDTLWDLAERHLGSGHRYAEIRDLNLGLPQPDGRALTDAHWVYPGWRLLLPSDAVGVAGTAASPSTSATTPYTVDAGDTLWDVATQELGDPLRYPEIVDLNVGRAQPDGDALRDPDLIRPGWLLELPAPRESTQAARGSTASPTDDSLDDGTGALDGASRAVDDAPPNRANPQETDDGGAGAVSDGAERTDDAAPGRHLAMPPAEMFEEGNDEETITVSAEGDSEVEMHGLFLGLTALAAAGVVGEITRRRVMQQRVRRIGRRIPLPTPGSSADDAERALRAAVPPMTIARLKASFLDLATRCYQAERDLPRVGAVTVTPASVVLHLTEDDDAPVEPYTATDARTWTAHEALADRIDAEDPDRPEPFPALVTLGNTSEGTVLVNLEAAGTLTIAGDRTAATEILRALVAELATSDLTGRIGLVATPDFEPLAQACDPARLQIAPVEAIGPTVDRRAHEVRQATADAGVDDTLQARSDRIVGDVWLPVVFVTTAASVAVASPWSGATVVAAGTPGEDGWTLIADGPAARLEPLGIDVAPQRLTLEDFDRLVELLTVAAPPTGGEPPAGHQPVAVEILEAFAAMPAAVVNEEAGDDAGDELGGARSPVRICVLGPITIDGLPSGAASLSRRSTELLVYLALRGRATGPELDEALWCGARVDKQTRNSLVYRTRQRVGANVLPVVGADGIYRLGDAVTSDWADFQRNARRGLAAGPPALDDLRAAVDLVRDRPLLGVPDSAFTWAEHDIQEMISTIADVTHVLTRLLLERGETRAGLEVATRGLAVDAWSELLLGDALEAAVSIDDTTTVRRLRAKLTVDAEEPQLEGWQAVDADSWAAPVDETTSHSHRG